MNNKFDDIRPYIDSEVNGVIDKLLANKEFHSMMAGTQLPNLKRSFPNLASALAKKSIKKKLRGLNSIKDVQEVICKYVDHILDNSTTSLVDSGMSELPMETPHLFISNHRDIVMDPALISYLLRESVYGTVEIAIGDNLLKQEHISDLMRLNKSFIVKRSVQGREKLMASKQLSEYIHHAVDTGSNVWIAQREGRAKDGLDKTDPTILKMFHLGMRDIDKSANLRDTINKLHIIPVSISYEYDPCAELKATELYEIEVNGSFEKDERSDINSISTGMKGQKGNVHVSFGTEIIADSDDPVEIAAQIDRQVILNYHLHPSNYLAYEKLHLKNPLIGPSLKDLNVDMAIVHSKRTEFELRLEEIPHELRPNYLKMYANSVINKFQFKE